MPFDGDLHFPRASASDQSLLLEIHGQPVDEITEQPFDLRLAEFHPAARERVSAGSLGEWRTELNRWAHDQGFPAPLTERLRSRWNVRLGTRLLEDTEALPERENPAVWSWIAIHLLPHFVVYRWGWPAATPNGAPTRRSSWDRFGSSQKNALFLARYRVLVHGPELAEKALEQEFQSVEYRTAFGLDRRVARVILETLVSEAEDSRSNYGSQGSTRSDDADDVCVELRLINSLRPFSFLSDARIEQIVRETIERLPEIRDPRKEARRRKNKPSGPELAL